MIIRVGMQPDASCLLRPNLPQRMVEQEGPEFLSLRIGHQAEIHEFDVRFTDALELAKSCSMSPNPQDVNMRRRFLQNCV